MKKAVMLGLALLVCIGLFWMQGTQLEAEREKVRELSGEIETLRNEAAAAAKAQADSADLKRLRDEQSELARLRNEVTQLRRQVKDANAAKAKVSATPPTPEPSEETPLAMQYKSFEATNRVVMGWKQTIVVGGWTTEAGRRVFVFSRPESITAEKKGGQVLVESKVFEVPEALSTQLGLSAGTQPSNKESSAPTLVLTAEEAEGIRKQLEQNGEVKILSSPRVIAADGVTARINIGQNVPLASGEEVFRRTTLELTPQASEDGTSVDLTIISRLDFPNKTK